MPCTANYAISKVGYTNMNPPPPLPTEYESRPGRWAADGSPRNASLRPTLNGEPCPGATKARSGLRGWVQFGDDANERRCGRVVLVADRVG